MPFVPKCFLYIPSVNKNLEADLSQTLYEHQEFIEIVLVVSEYTSSNHISSTNFN